MPRDLFGPIFPIRLRQQSCNILDIIHESKGVLGFLNFLSPKRKIGLVSVIFSLQRINLFVETEITIDLILPYQVLFLKLCQIQLLVFNAVRHQVHDIICHGKWI